MEVRKGYKQTEVGVIPEDWDVVSIGDVSKIFGRIGFRGYTINDIVKEGEGAITISPSNIQDNKTDFSNCTYISWRKYEESPEIKIEDGDILLVKTGSTVGKTAIVKKLPEPATINPQIVVLKKVKISKVFFGYSMGFDVIQGQLRSATVGGALPTLSQKQVAQFKFPLPSTLAEQEAIAEALSDADALIESLETLLAKKRQVKQGAMSELLGGKRRVVGSGEWKVKKLGDIFEIGAGGDFDPARSSDVQDERFPYPIYSNAITDNGLYGFCSYNDHQSGSITVTARGTLGVSNYRDHDFTAIGRVIVLKPTQPLDGRFISEYINNRIEFVVESTGVPQLTAPQISKYEILFPPFEEQTAIAEILSDMDAEIRAVEEKLSKARAVKAGMMSELLGGRIRLV